MPELPDPKAAIKSVIIDWLNPKSGGLVQQTVVRLGRRSLEQAVADFAADSGASRILGWRKWL